MLAAGMVDLFVRMLTSLAVVLALVAIAYAVMRRRAATGSSTARPSRRVPPSAVRRSVRAPRRGHRHQPIEVIGRVGLSRSSAAVALKFGDRVLLVGASEQAQPTVLAEIDAATWELADAEAEWAVPAQIEDARSDVPGDRPTFLDALREATVRRA